MNNYQLSINDYPLYNEELIMEGKKQRIVNYQLSIKNYPLYKDSAIDWIGEIPEHWDIKRLKDLGFLYSGLTGKAGSDFTNEHQWSCDFIPFVNIANNQYISLSDMKKVIVTPQEKQNQVKKHDLFFLMSSENYEDIGKTALLRSDIRSTYLNSFCKGFRFTTKKIEPNFANYLFSSRKYRDSFAIEGKGFTRINLKIEKVNNLFFLLPPLREQVEIAHYLDTKTAQIDRKIDLLTQKAKRYEELKRAIVNETVTRGLDKSVPMKDSAIEWIGEIPEHWEIHRIKDFTYVKGRIGWQGLRSSDFLDTGDYYCVTGTDLVDGLINWSDCYFVSKSRYEQDKYIQLKVGDLLITKDGTIGKTALVDALPKEATLNSGLFVTRPLKDKYLNVFLYWVLHSSVFRNYIDLTKGGSTIQHLYQNVFDRFLYCCPPLTEQKEISDYLSRKSSHIDQIIQNINLQIEKQQELRKTLINDVVTGKIKVIDN